MERRERGRRRALLAKLGLFMLVAATCNNNRSCSKGCDGCDSSSVADAFKCDCSGRPGCSGSSDGYDGDYVYDDDDGYTTSTTSSGTGAGPSCEGSYASCNGPPYDADGCESDLLSRETCGHCLRACSAASCVSSDGSTTCDETVLQLDVAQRAADMAAAGLRLYWVDDASLNYIDTSAGRGGTFPHPGVEIEADETHAFVLGPAGDILAVEVPSGDTVPLAGPSGARLLRTDGEALYWLDGGTVYRSAKTNGPPAVFLEGLDGYDVRDFAVDGTRVYMAGYEASQLGVSFVWVDAATLDSGTIVVFGPDADPSSMEIEVTEDAVYVGHSYGVDGYAKDGTYLPGVTWTTPTLYTDLRVRESIAYYLSGGVVVWHTTDGYAVPLHQETASSFALATGVVYIESSGAIVSVPW